MAQRDKNQNPHTETDRRMETHQAAEAAAASCKHRGSLALSAPQNEPLWSCDTEWPEDNLWWSGTASPQMLCGDVKSVKGDVKEQMKREREREAGGEQEKYQPLLIYSDLIQLCERKKGGMQSKFYKICPYK